MKLTKILMLLILSFGLRLEAKDTGPKTPKEFIKGKLDQGQVWDHPFTMFNRNRDNSFDWKLDVIRIKLKIFEGHNKLPTQTSYAFQMYRELLDFARGGEPGLCTHDEDGCSHPHWVKANAFINMVGLDITTNSGGFMVVSEMTSTDYFKNNAIGGLKRLNYKIPPCWGGSKNCPNVRQHAMRLIGYLQAYDMLRTVGSISGDINCRSDCPRENLRKYTSELYQASSRIINSNLGWKKNHGIICASALGMAAIVLGHAGGKKDKYDPNKWFQRAHGRPHNTICLDECDDGLEDNFFVGRQAGNNVPTTNADGTAGFSEGPGYFLDVAHALFPYMRANDNALKADNKFNLLKDKRYIEILTWYYKTLDRDGQIPQYDNSSLQGGNIFGVLGVKDFKGNPTSIRLNFALGTPNVDLRVDYLLALAFLDGSKPEPEEDYYNSNSGNYIFYDETDKGKFTLHALFETGIAVDKPGNNRDGTHEDEDFGSFTIHAMSNNHGSKNVPLIIDPGYHPGRRYKNVSLQGYFGQHSTFQINNALGNILINGDEILKVSKKVGINYRGYEFEMSRYLLGWPTTLNNQRTFQSWHTNDEKIYYKVIDNSTGSPYSRIEYKVNITGNGHYNLGEDDLSNSPKTFRKEQQYHIYSYPCRFIEHNDRWKILHTYNIINDNNNDITEYYHTFEPNMPIEDHREYLTHDPLITLNYNGKTDYFIAQHTQLEFIFSAQIYKMESIYIPLKCEEELPLHFRNPKTGISYLSLGFKENIDTSENARKWGNGSNQSILDTSSHFHLLKESSTVDTIINPFKLNSEVGKILSTDARKLFINLRSTPYIGKSFGYCKPSYSKFRELAAENIKILSYGMDTMVIVDEPIDFSYGLFGKNKFRLMFNTITTPQDNDTIKLKLPGIDRGLEMIALIDNTKDTLHGRYDSLTNYIYLGLKEGKYSITIQPKNPCLDCYFPPLGTDFDTLFLANDGLPHTLGNSKEIKDNHGNLSILNSTKVSMCAGVILHNKDSLILEGPAQTKAIAVSSCTGIDSLAKNSNNSMLIISSGAALVLDAGSQTYIKNGASLFVKQNGSLVIKSGATLEIGDSGRAGWGELIAEPGAFIYIEDGAQIRYRRRIGDTADINTINFAIGNGGVIAGIHWYIDSVLKAESILPSVTSPVAFCSLDSINPIGNPYWGYTNFGKPKATFITRSLNLCPREPFHIKLNRLLNDAQMRITVCRVDSVWRFDGNGNGFWKDTCVNDSIVMDSLPPDPNCLKPRVAPEDWLWYFPVNTTHRVHITVKNECGWAHDTLVEVVVKDTPQISLNMNTTACEGYGTIKAAARVNRTGPVHYAFEVTELPDTLNPIYSQANPTEEYSFDTLATVPDTFDFPGFYFKGGRKYIISFTLLDECGNTTLEQEVSVPTGAYIQLERPTVYANPVHGARQVQLHGYVNSADSFSWNPTTWLNRTDSLVVISTPGDSIQYVLTAYKNNCVAYDTATIKYNRVANAGIEDTVCYTSSKVVLGNGYDLSLLLGYLYYKGGSDFRNNWFFSRTSANPEYFKYLSMFMQTTTFKGWAMGANNLYDDFTELLDRQSTIKQPWFANYFEQLTAFTDPNMYALDSFVYHIDLNNFLSDNYTQTGNYSNYVGSLSDFFLYYDDFVSNYLNTISMSWHKIVGNDTLFNGSLQESAIAVDEPTKTTIYLQQVITPEYAEIDEVTIYVDTIPVVAFAPQMQVDSTVLFENFTEPTDGATHYSWNFGDGSPLSTDVHPLHTFPAFDTSFVVCLTAINDCGNYTWCDTVYIDSAHWGGSMRLWSEEREGVTEGERVATDGIEALLYPNPTEGNSTLAYTINEDATLYITDAMGKLIWQTALSPARSQMPAASRLIQIPSQTFTNGIYFYTIQTPNGSARGKFVVRR